MPSDLKRLSVTLKEDTYWGLFAWAVRNHKKAHEQLELIADQAVAAENERQQQTEPTPEQAA
jgi:hypothetical protein